MDTQELSPSTQRQPHQRQSLQVITFLFVAIGFAFISLWTDLIGHSPALASSNALVIPLANPRSVYLLGLIGGGALFALFPRRLDFRWLGVQPLAGALIGLASFGYVFAGALEPSAGRVVAILGLLIIGMGFAWLSIRFLAQLAQEERYSFVVAAIACGLFLKTLLGAFVGPLAPIAVQGIITIALPFAASLLLICSQLSLNSIGGAVDLEELPKIPAPQRRVLLLLLLMNSLLRGVIRVMSSMGFWGDDVMPASQLLIFDFVLLALFFAAAAYFTLTRQNNPDPIVRFLPAFLVILAGFFVLDPQVLALLRLNVEMAFVLNIFVELFAHLFFWAIIVFGIRSLSIHPFRVAGVAVALYATASALLTFAVPNPDVAYRLISVMALYVFIVVLMFASRILRTTHVGVEGHGALVSAKDSSLRFNPDATTGDLRSDARTSESLVAARLSELAREGCLSPRETEVFLLLAQGRSRPYIQQELFLADGTVKTHISRIYGKLGCTNRQELITLVQESPRQQETSD
jgi:DNA-binding CsgD family transcriptional regulator